MLANQNHITKNIQAITNFFPQLIRKRANIYHYFIFLFPIFCTIYVFHLIKFQNINSSALHSNVPTNNMNATLCYNSRKV